MLIVVYSRVVYVFGPPVKEAPTDVTPTFLTTGVLSTLRQADFEAHNILRESGKLFLLCNWLSLVSSAYHFNSCAWVQQTCCIIAVTHVIYLESLGN